MKWLSLHVGGQKWRIDLVSRRSKKLASETEILEGLTDVDTCRIYVAKDLSPEGREDALLHEILHAVFFVSGARHQIDDLCTDGEHTDVVEERIIRCLTPVLHRVLKDLSFHFPKGPA